MRLSRLSNLLLAAASVLLGQDPAPAVQVTGAVKQQLTLTAEDLARLPRATVRTSLDGKELKYEGVWLFEVLKKAGVPVGGQQRRVALTSYVIAEAKDGYQVLFSLGEIDPFFADNEVLLADSLDGQPLSGPQGSFRLVLGKDERGARSVRMLVRLEVAGSRK